MKRLYFVIITLFLINVALFNSKAIANIISDLSIAQVESLNGNECFSGGIGAKSCSIGQGIIINGETTKGCSVDCGQGYYACCGIHCYCISIFEF